MAERTTPNEPDAPETVGDVPITVVSPGEAAARRSAETAAAIRASESSDRTTQGQRKINVMWETTQGVLAVILVGTSCWTTGTGQPMPPEFWLLVGIVVAAYFQRTNHTRVGGVGIPPEGGR